MIDINELRRLAQEATPGPWQFWHGWVATEIDKDGGFVIVERPTPSGGKYQARVDSNFKFIAAANPQAILELLDRLEAAEEDIAIKEEVIDSLAAVVKRLDAQCDAAEAEAIEQSRLNGMGSEREAALMTKIDRLRRALMAMTKGYKSVPYAQWSPEMHFAAEVLEEIK